MNRFTHSLWQRAIAGGVGVALFGSGMIVHAQEAVPVALPKIPAAQLQQWLADLDSDSFEVREAAAEKLAQAGPAAVDVLSSGIVSESAEVAWRSGASLERIALGGDEKTLARITNILDGLSTKGRPGLKTMAAEMHVRQKHFKHDRAVASLKQNGAVFASDGMELGGGPAFFGGPLAVGGPVMIEAIADEVIEVADDVPAEPVPAKPEGIFGLIGRVLEGALKVAEEPPVPRVEIRRAAPEFIPDAPPALAPPALLPVEEKISEPVREEKSAIEGKPAEEKLDEPAKILEEFKELAEPAKEAAPAEAQALAPPPLLEEPIEVVEGAAVPIAVDFGAVGIIDADLEEVETVATLVVGKQWRGGDEGLKVLKDVPEIYSITISGAKISDASLPYMAELPNLSNLMIHDVGVTRQGLRKLREQKPDLQIQARGEAMMGVNADVGTSPLVLTSIFPDSGAFQAGIREGDVVLSVDGNPIKDFADLTISIYGCKAGEKVRVEYERNGAKKTTEVTLKKRPDGQ
ncbi:MAG: PDZ domain-containing protein [Planctomycetales bacterium]|nr:PDZ domain-containing protein [Planctomycetales bacterium]